MPGYHRGLRHRFRVCDHYRRHGQASWNRQDRRRRLDAHLRLRLACLRAGESWSPHPSPPLRSSTITDVAQRSIERRPTERMLSHQRLRWCQPDGHRPPLRSPRSMVRRTPSRSPPPRSSRPSSSARAPVASPPPTRVSPTSSRLPRVTPRRPSRRCARARERWPDAHALARSRARCPYL